MANLSYKQNIIGDDLTTESVQELQRYGALEWNPRDIAISMGFDIDQFTAEYKDPDSIVSLAITRGRLQAQAVISTKVLDNAKLGDLPSRKNTPGKIVSNLKTRHIRRLRRSKVIR